LTGEWVLVSPHRTKRPWQGQVEKLPDETKPDYDPRCYLCPGNSRSGGARNPDYQETFVFTNDFQALLPESEALVSGAPLFQSAAVRGTCRVICFSPRHDLSLPEMEIANIRKVIDLWGDQVEELGQTYQWVQVFENKGAVMGSSNPHPHGQIWALDQLPNEPAKDDLQQRKYFQENGRPLLLDYQDAERNIGERTVVENEHWLAVVPYWAIWPFEILLLPGKQVSHLHQLTETQKQSLA
jgi:UDPglucose--hexose-1-phosphate uridylyltransferase